MRSLNVFIRGGLLLSLLCSVDGFCRDYDGVGVGSQKGGGGGRNHP